MWNVLTSEVKPYTAKDMMTFTLDFASLPASEWGRLNSELHTIFEDGICDDEAVTFVVGFLRELFPEENLFWEVLKLLSYIFFTPYNLEKIVVELWGKTNNGKSTLIRVLQNVFGQDWVRVESVNVLAATSQPSKTNLAPWIDNSRHCRLVCMSESDLEVKISSGEIKSHSGGLDKVIGRQLSTREDESFTPGYTLLFVANQPLRLSQEDAATDKRRHSYRMPSSFGDVHDPSTFQFPVNLMVTVRFTEDPIRYAFIMLLRVAYERKVLEPLGSLLTPYRTDFSSARLEENIFDKGHIVTKKIVNPNDPNVSYIDRKRLIEYAGAEKLIDGKRSPHVFILAFEEHFGVVDWSTMKPEEKTAQLASGTPCVFKTKKDGLVRYKGIHFVDDDPNYDDTPRPYVSGGTGLFSVYDAASSSTTPSSPVNDAPPAPRPWRSFPGIRNLMTRE